MKTIILIFLSLFTMMNTQAQTGQYASVNGLKMYYEIHGKGEPLVLIHGAASTIQTTFGRILPALSQTHQVIAVELQAHGHTSDIDRVLSFENDADDIAALLKHLGIQKASFFGFSNGATTAIQVAIRHPQLVNKLILASAIYKRDGAFAGFFENMKTPRFEDMPQLYKDAFMDINNDSQALYVMFEKCAARMQTFKDIPDSAIEAITAPTLILLGDADVATPEHATEMFRRIKGSRLMIVPCGHGDFIGEIMSLNGKHSNKTIALPVIEDFLKP